MPKLRPNGRIRLSMDLEPEWEVTLEMLQRRIKAISHTEVFRKSVTLLDTITSHLQSGDVILRHADGREENLRIL